MNFSEILKILEKGKEAINQDWNGIKSDKIMYIKLQKPDENSLNTEPYIIMYHGEYLKGDEEKGTSGRWKFKRFPWFPNVLDLNSTRWIERVVETQNVKSLDIFQKLEDKDSIVIVSNFYIKLNFMQHLIDENRIFTITEVMNGNLRGKFYSKAYINETKSCLNMIIPKLE